MKTNLKCRHEITHGDTESVFTCTSKSARLARIICAAGLYGSLQYLDYWWSGHEVEVFYMLVCICWVPLNLVLL